MRDNRYIDDGKSGILHKRSCLLRGIESKKPLFVSKLAVDVGLKLLEIAMTSALEEYNHRGAATGYSSKLGHRPRRDLARKVEERGGAPDTTTALIRQL